MGGIVWRKKHLQPPGEGRYAAEAVGLCAHPGRAATRVDSGEPKKEDRAVCNRFVVEHPRSVLLTWPLQGMAPGDIYQEAISRDAADLTPLYTGQRLRMLDSVKGKLPGRLLFSKTASNTGSDAEVLPHSNTFVAEM